MPRSWPSTQTRSASSKHASSRSLECWAWRPGRVDEETGAITIDDAGDAVNYGVVDEIARPVWLNGGRVLAVRRDDIPGKGSVAAILRYAP